MMSRKNSCIKNESQLKSYVQSPSKTNNTASKKDIDTEHKGASPGTDIDIENELNKLE